VGLLPLAHGEAYVVQYFAVLFGLALGVLVSAVLLVLWARKPRPERSAPRGVALLVLLLAAAFLLVGWWRGPAFFRSWW
jgi:hypothetical protein